MELPRALTDQETALLKELSPRAFPEAMTALSGFSVMAVSWGCLAMSADMVVSTTYSIWDGTRHVKKHQESCLLPISRALQMERLGLISGILDRKTGEIGRVGVQLLLVSTSLVTFQPDRTLKRVL
jgi:multidrug transporter EmrE-like cation transporter